MIDYVLCENCWGGGFTGNTGDLEEDACKYCNGLGSLPPEEVPLKCSYCEEIVDTVAGTPFMGDIEHGAQMCKFCWEGTREEYLGSDGEDIGEFPEEDE